MDFFNIGGHDNCYFGDCISVVYDFSIGDQGRTDYYEASRSFFSFFFQLQSVKGLLIGSYNLSFLLSPATGTTH